LFSYLENISCVFFVTLVFVYVCYSRTLGGNLIFFMSQFAYHLKSWRTIIVPYLRHQTD